MKMSIRIRKSDRLFVLTGAGISAESGIPTFRGQDGLWEGHRIEDVATPQAFAKDPELVWRFYSMRRSVAAACKPNPGHIALARLGEMLGKRMFLCTQNVDSLHEAAGSVHVFHMHGQLFQSRCSERACPTKPFEDSQTYKQRSENSFLQLRFFTPAAHCVVQRIASSHAGGDTCDRAVRHFSDGWEFGRRPTCSKLPTNCKAKRCEDFLRWPRIPGKWVRVRRTHTWASR